MSKYIGTKVVIKLPLEKYETVYGMKSSGEYLGILTSAGRMFVINSEYEVVEVKYDI